VSLVHDIGHSEYAKQSCTFATWRLSLRSPRSAQHPPLPFSRCTRLEVDTVAHEELHACCTSNHAVYLTSGLRNLLTTPGSSFSNAWVALLSNRPT